MKFRSLLVLAIVGACGVAVPGHAAKVLRLEDAVTRALGAHPSLKADAAQLEAARSRAGREALAPSLQVYGLIALLQSASACFTPLLQPTISEILKDERDYTRALSLSRLAYDLESLLSSALAAALLTVISFHGLFAGTSAGFVFSAMLVASTAFTFLTNPNSSDGPYARAIRGMCIYLHTPRLQGLLALNVCAAAGGAMVFVNTVLMVRTVLGGTESQVASALAAFGGGSMLVALLLPKVLDRFSDRVAMLSAALAMVVTRMAES